LQRTAVLFDENAIINEPDESYPVSTLALFCSKMASTAAMRFTIQK